MLPCSFALGDCSEGFRNWAETGIQGRLCFACSIIFDSLAFISTLVVGILGVMSIIEMPLAASYALIGIGSTIGLMYISFFIIRHIQICAWSTDLQ